MEFHRRSSSIPGKLGILAGSFNPPTIAHFELASAAGFDIVRECRTHFGSDTRLYLICGRDAAERIFTWDYGRPGVLEEMLGEVELLVAPRGGEFQPPPEFERRIHSLGLHGEHDHVSSSEVRERIARGDKWEHLVPQAIVERVRDIYGRRKPPGADCQSAAG